MENTKKAAQTICNSSLLLYNAINLMPATTVLSFIIISTFNNRVIFGFVLSFFYMARTLSSYSLSNSDINISKYYNSLKRLFALILLIPIGYFVVLNTQHKTIGALFFTVGLMAYGRWEGEGIIVRFFLYRKSNRLTDLIYNEQGKFEIARMISLILSIFFIVVNIEEELKIQIILTLIPIVVFLELFYIRSKHKLQKNEKFKTNLKERLVDFIQTTREIKGKSLATKSYLLSNILANIGGISLVYITVYSKGRFDLEFVDILKIKIISSIFNFILISIKSKMNLKHTGKYYLTVARIIIVITLLLVLFSPNLILIYIAFILYSVAVMFLTLGKKVVIKDLSLKEEEKNDFYGYSRLIQGIFASGMFLVSTVLIQIGFTDRHLIWLGIVFYSLSSIVILVYLNPEKKENKIKLIG